MIADGRTVEDIFAEIRDQAHLVQTEEARKEIDDLEDASNHPFLYYLRARLRPSRRASYGIKTKPLEERDIGLP